MENVDGLISRNLRLLHVFMLFQLQAFRSPRKEAENYICLTYFCFFFLILHFICSSWMILDSLLVLR